MANRIQEISTGYSPRPLQRELHPLLRRFNVLVKHRRYGKTVFGINEKIHRSLQNQLRNPQYAYIAPTYGQAKRVAWDYFKQYTEMIPGMFPNEAELRIDIPRPALNDRVRYMLLGAENPGSLKGLYLDGVILDEYAEMDPIIWTQVVRPMLSDRKGWAIFMGTPKGKNHFYDIWELANKFMREGNPDWFARMSKASETGIVPKDELEAARQLMGEEAYMQEFECSFTASLVGAYFGKEMALLRDENRICKVPYDRSVPVITAWDLGISDTTCIWFIQLVGKAIHVIDYIEMSGMGLDYYARLLRERGYDYEEHLLPHDAAARDLSTGKTRVETLRKLGLRHIRVVPKLAVEDGINAVRTLLPRCWFDEVKTNLRNELGDRGRGSLESYERKWDSKNKIFQPRPLHNWASHGADAFRTLAVGLREDTNDTRNKPLPDRCDNQYSIFGR